ncbi:MAG: hypothetical protein ABGW77_00240 [Campylobacterales bacterium]
MEKLLFALLQLLLLFSGIVILVTSVKSYPFLSTLFFGGVLYLIYYLLIKFFFDDN